MTTGTSVTPDVRLEIGRDLSVDYFNDPETYQPFTAQKCGRITLGCIEPRDQEGLHRGQFAVHMQSPGGGPGEGFDSALALTYLNEQLVVSDTGLEHDKATRPGMILGGHLDCTFLKYIRKVTAEVANPTDLTTETALYIARRAKVEDLVRKNWDNIRMAADIHLEFLDSQASMYHLEDDDKGHPLLDKADKLYPDAENVIPVKGTNIARVYALNFHPILGKNRNNKSHVPEIAELTQGYHDGIGAGIASLDPSETKRMSDDVRDLKLVARLFRTAAARTVITGNIIDETIFLNIFPTRKNPSGLHIVEGINP